MLHAVIAEFQGSQSPRLRPQPMPPASYQGPERRAAGSPSTRWLSLMLDEVDYGMLLTEGLRVLHANHAAHAERDGNHPLQIHGGTLRARDAQDMMRLQDSLAGARRGLRRLVTGSATHVLLRDAQCPMFIHH